MTVSKKKDDRLSHQLSKNDPNFYANKEMCLSLDIWCSRKAIKCLLKNIWMCSKYYHKCNKPITKTERKTNSNKWKTFSLRTEED